MSDAATLWPWLAVAGAGALHGLNPCTGWALAAARGVRSGHVHEALRAVAPLACGHAVSVAVVAGLVALGVSMSVLPLLAGVGLIAAALLLWRRGRAGLALWSFGIATAHGSGLTLVPALVPLCLSASPAREITASGSLLLALAAVAVHMAAMLVVTSLLACVACGGAGVAKRWVGVSLNWARHRRACASVAQIATPRWHEFRPGAQ